MSTFWKNGATDFCPPKKIPPSSGNLKTPPHPTDFFSSILVGLALGGVLGNPSFPNIFFLGHSLSIFLFDPQKVCPTRETKLV